MFFESIFGINYVIKIIKCKVIANVLILHLEVDILIVEKGMYCDASEVSNNMRTKYGL